MNGLYSPFFLLLLCMLSAPGCAYLPPHNPDLPAEHWIEEAAGMTTNASRPVVDVRSTTLDFDAALALALEQSPLLTHSAIEMEIARLETESASWSRLPELRARFSVTANVTQNDDSNTDDDYGQPAYRASLDIAAYNPIAATFAYSSRQLMEQLALLTHIKAVEEMAERIGEILVRIETLHQLHGVQARLPDLADRMVEYYKALEPGEEQRSLEYAYAQQKLRVVRAQVDKNETERAMQRTALKMVLGLAPEDPCHVLGPGAVLDGPARNSRSISWQEAWASSPDCRMLDIGMQLQDANILLAWSRYLPEVNLKVFSDNADSPLYGTSHDDLFVNAGISFPILDWGKRARGVVMARLQKTQFAARQEQARQEFAAAWSHGQQEFEALRAETALQEETLKLNRLELRKARILFDSNIGSMREVMEREEQVIRQECRLIELQGRLRTWRIKARIRGGALRETLLRFPAAAE